MSGKERKVGILSMQRVANYGSFLQAWALREILRREGADVWFMDIVPGRQLSGYRFGGAGAFVRRLAELTAAAFTGRLGAKWRGRKFHRAMRAKYRNEYYAMLDLDRPVPERLDLAVIGSDQVFNCFEVNPWGFTTQLYGDIPQADRIVSYAGSFGNATYDKLKQAGVTKEISENLAKLAAISVRDDNSHKLVLKLTGRQASKHLDPVLIHDFSKELEGRSSGRKDFIVVYSYPERISSPAEIEAIRRYAKTRGKKLISILSACDWCDEAVIPDTPFDVLACFRDADCVITDTFHGSVFSIVTGSRFCTLVRNSNSNKLGSLLNWLGLENRIAASPDDIAEILMEEPDYSQVRSIIEAERERTREYIIEALQ